MWEINSNFQVMSFIGSIILGGIFSLLFDVFKAFRISFKMSGVAVFITDIIYFLSIALLSFCYFLATTDGEIRLFIIFGCFLGFIIFRFLISRYLTATLSYIIKKIIKIFSLLNTYINILFDKISQFFTAFFNKAIKFLKNIKNIKKTLEKS